MDAILSIKPEYCEKIRSGEKKFEFRKTRFRDCSEIDRVIIYSTSPVKKIIGYFIIDEIISDSPEALWRQCREYSGIDKESYFRYFAGNNVGYALRIGETFFCDPINPYEIIPNFNAPQSFCYMKEPVNF